jgi:hypothetical protein
VRKQVQDKPELPGLIYLIFITTQGLHQDFQPQCGSDYQVYNDPHLSLPLLPLSVDFEVIAGHLKPNEPHFVNEAVEYSYYDEIFHLLRQMHDLPSLKLSAEDDLGKT